MDADDLLEGELQPDGYNHGVWICPPCIRMRRDRHDMLTPLAGTILDSICGKLFRWSGDQELGKSQARCERCAWTVREGMLRVCWSCGETKERRR